MMLLESLEILNVTPQPLSKTLVFILKKFQEFIRLIQLKSYEYSEIVDLYQQLKPFQRYYFAKQTIQHIEEYLQSVSQSKFSHMEIDWSEYDILKHVFLMKQLSSIHIDTLHHLSQELNQIFYHLKNQKREFTGFKLLKKDAMNLFFSAGEVTGLMSSLDTDTLRKISQYPIEHMYSYLMPQLNAKGQLKCPEDTSEIEYLIYLIEHLVSDPRPIRLNHREYEVYKRWTDDHYTKLRSYVKQYIRYNDQQAIEHFNREMTPDIHQAIMASVRPLLHSSVYRGIGLSENDKKNDVIRKNKEQQYVSTSPDEDVAKRFARGIGHLEDASATRNHRGAIIEYDISDPRCIVFYTNIFGTVYNETDLIIRTSFAKIKNIQLFRFIR